MTTKLPEETSLQKILHDNIQITDLWIVRLLDVYCKPKINDDNFSLSICHLRFPSVFLCSDNLTNKIKMNNCTVNPRISGPQLSTLFPLVPTVTAGNTSVFAGSWGLHL